METPSTIISHWELALRALTPQQLTQHLVEKGLAPPTVEGTCPDEYTIDVSCGDGYRIDWEPWRYASQARDLFWEGLPKRGWTPEALKRPQGHTFVNAGACEATKARCPTVTILWGSHRICQGVLTECHAMLLVVAITAAIDI